MIPLAIVLVYLAPKYAVSDVELVPPTNPEEALVMKLQNLYEDNDCAVSPWAENGVPFPTKIIYYSSSIDDARIGDGALLEDAIAQEYYGVNKNLNVLAWCP